MIIVITQSDGDVHIDVLDEQQFIARLEQEYYGTRPVFVRPASTSWAGIASSGSNPHHWEDNGMMVIRGEVIFPHAKVVTKIEGWEL